jgi:nucleoside 2-deoxyribosyltransferase
MQVYLAGPDVFLPDAIEIGRRKVELCARHGLTGLYPLDNAVDLSAADASLRVRTPAPSMNLATWRDAENSASAIPTILPFTPSGCGI